MRALHVDPASGTVLNWIDTEAFGYASLPPDSQCVTVSNDVFEQVKSGGTWYVINGALSTTPPEVAAPTIPLNTLKAQKLDALNKQAQSIADLLTAGYPEFEKLTWETQRRESLAWSQDDTVPTPYIDVLALERGIDRVDYLQRTVAKTTAYEATAQKLVGQRQKFEDQIKAVMVQDGEHNETAAKEQLAAIVFTFSL